MAPKHNYQFPDYSEEDAYKGYDFGDTPQIDYNQFYSYIPRIDYGYLNINDLPDYCFHHPKFEKRDYEIYFERLKHFSQYTIDELITETDHTLHFKIRDPNRKELDILNTLILENHQERLKPEEIPQVGHFALYTQSREKVEKASKSGEKLKSPRIFFFLGQRGVFHILFFDPFHDIHPLKLDD